jgi:uncharacterized protein YbgA (DUF1722 family)
MTARLTEDERWLLDVARRAARRWLDSHPDDYLSTERTFADYINTLAKIIDGLIGP